MLRSAGPPAARVVRANGVDRVVTAGLSIGLLAGELFFGRGAGMTIQVRKEICRGCPS